MVEDQRTQYEKSRDRAQEWARRILAYGIEESCPPLSSEVALYDRRFAQYCDMMEHLKTEYYAYLRDKYGQGQY
jgi:hypothetical protein